MADIYLRFADGSINENGEASLEDETLWIYPAGMTLQETANLAFQTTKLSAIDAVYSGQTSRYDGYSFPNLIARDDGENKIRLLNEPPESGSGATPKADAALIFGDGTRLEGCSAEYAGLSLWLYLPGYTLQEASAIAFDEGKVRRIDYVYREETVHFEGFKIPNRIAYEDGEAKIRLVAGETPEASLNALYPNTFIMDYTGTGGGVSYDSETDVISVTIENNE